MSLAVGTKLGVFELSTLLGVGGMGEVYRARDTKLGREVAIKVLPEEFAQDRDRLARFQREARLLAALNHPNIAHIHDLLEAEGQHYLVMELVEGETLADRIRNGPLPLDDVLKYFGQIAEGLEAAHQQGVIHRDLKPANIKITDDGKVSVLDFGLAKAAEVPCTATNDGVTSPWDDHSAGKSSVGQIVGTPAYMSPEQARGKPVDKRTDIWAFGCCLYEALTGQRSFRGETVSDTLALILATEPDWKALPESTPPRLRELLESCLAKDVRERLHDIADARLDLRQIASNPNPGSTPAGLPAGAIMMRRSRLVAATIAGLLVASLAAGVAVWSVMRPAALPDQPRKIPQGVVRFTIDLPPESAIDVNPTATAFSAPRFALSPDGSRIVYAGGNEGQTKLYMRPMDKLESNSLEGTDGAMAPFFKPDGRWVGFFARGQLYKIRVDGGSQPVPLCEARNPLGATWGRDGAIYFAESINSASTVNRGLKRVRASGGGTPELITHTEVGSGVIAHVYPCALPDEKSVLFTLAGQTPSECSLAVLSITTGQVTNVVLPHVNHAQYVPTGHLLFTYGSWIYAARFDLNRRQVVGPNVGLMQSILIPALSDAGCLIHGPPGSGGSLDGPRPLRHLVWVNRKGKTERWKSPPRSYYGDLRLSPDGKRLAANVVGDRGTDIWIYNDEGENGLPLTSEGVNVYPNWTPDGGSVIFSSIRGRKPGNLFSAPADGSAPPRPLAPSDLLQQGQGSFHPYKPLLAFTQGGSATGYDIYALSLDGGGAAKPLIQAEFTQGFPAFSPDGNWLAYHSDETGPREVFVQPYPPTGANGRKVSDQGGSRPRWSAKGNELFYRNGRGLYAVQIETKPALKSGHPELLFEKPFAGATVRSDYDVAPDGRFVFIELTEAEAAQGPVQQLTVVQNWFEELERLLPHESAGEK